METYWTRLNELSPIDRLDIVLNFISTNNSVIEGITAERIDERLKSDGINLSKFHSKSYSKQIWKDSIPQLVKILNKLEQDGYVLSARERHYNTAGSGTYKGDRKYYSTFEGEVFNEKGGYRRQLRLENNRDKLKSIQRYLLMFGGIGGGIYGFLEMGKFLNNKHHYQILNIVSIEAVVLWVFLGIGICVGILIVILKREADSLRR